MLTENDIKSELSIAYVHAVASKAGFSTEINRVDRDSVDVRICAKGKLSDESVLNSPSIEVQLKATSSYQLKENRLAFPLKIKNYDDLRSNTMNPRILVVLSLPEENSNWLTHSADQLVIRKCAYWICLKGMPESENEESETIHISGAKIFSPEQLKEIMIKASKEEDI